MMKQPSIDARWTRSFATALKWLGFAAMGFGAALLVLLTASPLGLLRAYPAPPEAAVDDPLGLDRKITDLQSLDRNAGEPMEAYLRRLTTSVAGGMVHYWSRGDTWSEADAPYTEISIYDNYLLWLQMVLLKDRQHFRNYEFMTPAKAIDRGYGFCSQVSKTIYSILRDQGIVSVIYSNPSHTVVEADGDVLDADYGVFIPHSIAWVQQTADAIDTYYADYGLMVPLIRQAYAQPWHVLGTAAEFDNVRKYEAWFEWLKWLPPLLAIILGLAAVAIGAGLRRRELGRDNARPRHPSGQRKSAIT
jgi:hypothetical protein